MGKPAVRAHVKHGDTRGACPVTCGGESGIECDEGEFCKIEEGECGFDAEGVCEEFPEVCPSIFDPVCGCDGRTYSNSCFAEAAGATIEHPGACEVQVCGGSVGETCDAGQYCRRAEGECAEEAEGVCVDIPMLCPTNFEPVCGCDEMTYANECLAAAAGVTVASDGECVEEQPCGGSFGETCYEGQFCKAPEGECAEDAEGVCTSTPQLCPAIIAPVCGCDGVTYDNECVADGAGVTVAFQGECGEEQACGGSFGDTCEEGQFCKAADGECTEDAEGVCTEIPELCPTVFAPVCGCDGMTYTNECFADAAGATVQATGECSGI